MKLQSQRKAQFSNFNDHISIIKFLAAFRLICLLSVSAKKPCVNVVLLCGTCVCFETAYPMSAASNFSFTVLPKPLIENKLFSHILKKKLNFKMFANDRSIEILNFSKLRNLQPVNEILKQYAVGMYTMLCKMTDAQDKSLSHIILINIVGPFNRR